MKGDLAIYLDYVILGQLIPAKNNPENIDEYECKENEVKLYIPLYDINTGKFWGLDTHLAFIMVRGDADKSFFSYGYDESKSYLLYSTSKKMMTNIFQGTCFKKHISQILKERSTTDRNEEIIKFINNVSLHPIDCLYENFKQCSSSVSVAVEIVECCR